RFIDLLLVVSAGRDGGPRLDAAAFEQRADLRTVGQPVTVQRTIGMRRAVLYQAAEVGTACDERELGIRGVGRGSCRGIVGSRKREGIHGSVPPCRFGDSINDVGIASAATEVAAHPLTNLSVRQ